MSIVQPSADGKPAARKAIPKRTRYEVLARDNHTCRYCHASDSPLTIDHVIPVALGGTDDPSNLVAACRDCNYGKASSNPNAETVAQVNEDALRWRRAMELAVQEVELERRALDNTLAPFEHLWTTLAGGIHTERLEAPVDWRERLVELLNAGLPMETLLDATRIAFASPKADNVFYYALGVARNKLAELNDRARKILDRGVI